MIAYGRIDFLPIPSNGCDTISSKDLELCGFVAIANEIKTSASI